MAYRNVLSVNDGKLRSDSMDLQASASGTGTRIQGLDENSRLSIIPGTPVLNPPKSSSSLNQTWSHGKATPRMMSNHNRRRSGAPKLRVSSGISAPNAVKHRQHVIYNDVLARYEGLTEDQRHMNTQFGVPLAAVPKRHLKCYVSRIPAILVMLWQRVIDFGGIESVAISRRCSRFSQQIMPGRTKDACLSAHWKHTTP